MSRFSRRRGCAVLASHSPEAAQMYKISESWRTTTDQGKGTGSRRLSSLRAGLDVSVEVVDVDVGFPSVRRCDDVLTIELSSWFWADVSSAPCCNTKAVAAR